MVIIILAVTLGVATSFSARVQREQLLDSLITRGEALGSFVALISPPVILSYDFEGLTDTSEAMVYACMSHIMIRRLARLRAPL